MCVRSCVGGWVWVWVWVCVLECLLSLTLWFSYWWCCSLPKRCQIHWLFHFFLCSNCQSISYNLEKQNPDILNLNEISNNEIVRMNLSRWKIHMTLDLGEIVWGERRAWGQGAYCKVGIGWVAAKWMNTWISINYQVRKALTQRALVDFLLVHCQHSLSQTFLL